MTTETTNYLREAADDAADTVRNFADEILEQLLDDGKASDDLLNDYPDGDSWHHESHVDKWYSMIDAAVLIDQLDEFEETDSGLWQGQSFKDAISTCAAFTYGNAVMSEWHDLVQRINEKASDIIDDYDNQIDELEWGTEEVTEENDDARTAQLDRDAETLEAEKNEALRAMIEEVADAA